MANVAKLFFAETDEFLNGPNLSYVLFMFVSFSIQWQLKYNLTINRRRCAWDSNSVPKDGGMYRLMQWAMASPYAETDVTFDGV